MSPDGCRDHFQFTASLLLIAFWISCRPAYTGVVPQLSAPRFRLSVCLRALLECVFIVLSCLPHSPGRA